MPVNVKIQFVGLTSKELKSLENAKLVSSFDSSTPVKQILEKFQEIISTSGSDVEIFKQEESKGIFKSKKSSFETQVQILNRRISENELEGTLKSFGVSSGSCVLRVSWKSLAPVNSSNATGHTLEKKNHKIERSAVVTKKETKKPEVSTNSEKKEASFALYQPSESNKPLAASAEYEDIEMSVDDARKYQQMLKDKASSKSDYVKAKLKKEEEEKKKLLPQSVRDIDIRVKFPDMSIVQLKLNSGNTVEDMLQFLENKILIPDRTFKYNLVIPKFQLGNDHRTKAARQHDENIYWKSVEIGKKNDKQVSILSTNLTKYHQVSFIFEPVKPQADGSYIVDTTYKGPFIKNSPTAESVTTLVGEVKSSSEISKVSKFASKIKSDASKMKSDASEKKIPKWLKLKK